jgi:phosphoadenosine phosphosulfate reductase
MLIQSSRHTDADVKRWKELERFDAILAKSDVLLQAEDRAGDVLNRFADEGPCYCGVSWGKDSVVVAHLVRRVRPEIPLVWIRVDPIANPDCYDVRDVFLTMFPGPYYEIVRQCRIDFEGEIHAKGTLESGFKEACKIAGADRHVSGVRGQESKQRLLRMARWGESTTNTCAPIGWWKGNDVFAYLHKYGLPVHPAYAASMNGTLDRSRIRVASLWCERGKGTGRQNWEELYYRDELRRVWELRDSAKSENERK